jgi:hypothetical protein
LLTTIFLDCQSNQNPLQKYDWQSKSKSTFENGLTIQFKSNYHTYRKINGSKYLTIHWIAIRIEQSSNPIQQYPGNNQYCSISISFSNQVSISSTFYSRLFHTSVLRSFSIITVWLCNFFGKIILAQKLLENVNEIDYRFTFLNCTKSNIGLKQTLFVLSWSQLYKRNWSKLDDIRSKLLSKCYTSIILDRLQ